MSDTAANLRAQFPLLAAAPELHYLDSAATAQIHRAALDAVVSHETTRRANVMRGTYRLAEAADLAYEQARQSAARFLNAGSAGEIVFTPGATASLNLVAHAFGSTLKAGDRVLVSVAEHHSNFVPWQMLRDRCGIELALIPVGADGRLDLARLPGLMGDRCRLVAVTQCSNVTGAWTDAAGTEAFVAGEGKEIHAQRLDILRPVLHGLRAVEQHPGPDLARRGDDGGDIGPRAGDVGALRDGDKAAAAAHEFRQLRQVEPPVGIDRDQCQFDATAIAQHLPGYEVAVVFGCRNQYPVPRLQRRAEGMSDKIERRRGTGGEHDLVGRIGIEEAGHSLPRRFVGQVGGLGEAIGAAHDVGATRGFMIYHCLQRRTMDLRRGCAVEVVQFRHRCQQRELRAQACGGMVHRPFNPASASGVSTSAKIASSSNVTASTRDAWSASTSRAPTSPLTAIISAKNSRGQRMGLPRRPFPTGATILGCCGSKAASR